MNPGLKLIIKKFIPRHLINKMRRIYSWRKIARAKKIFEQAPEEPIWIASEMLATLQQQYPIPPTVSYSTQSLEKRGEKMAGQILKIIRKKSKNINSFLELGCGDGMVSCVLQRFGKITTAVDNRSENFCEMAVQEGVSLIKMDATNLQFGDEVFDFVFSYESFEHFANPLLVLQEAIRVVKTGGYIYLVFGPLYMSPYGLHAYRSITVPYCQFLFPKERLQEFVKEKKLNAIDFAQVNGWLLEEYHELFNQYSYRLKKIRYFEILDVSQIDLIMKYPSCFKSKTNYFDNLIVSSIVALFKKIR